MTRAAPFALLSLTALLVAALLQAGPALAQDGGSGAGPAGAPASPTASGIAGPGGAPSPAWLAFGLVSGDPGFVSWIGATALEAAGDAATRGEREAYLGVALKAYRRVLEIAPEDARARLALARTLALAGDDGAARGHLRKALEGELPPAVRRIVKERLETLERRVSAAPDATAPAGEAPRPERLEEGLASGDPESLHRIGTTALEAAGDAATRGEREAYLGVALKAYRRVTEIAPEEARPRLELARTLALLGEDDAARRQYRRVLAGELPPEVRRNVSARLEALGRREALPPPRPERLEEGLASGDPEVLFRTGAAATAAAEVAETREAWEAYLGVAVKAFRRLAEIAPEEARPRLELARALALLGKDGAARREYRKALAGGLPPDVRRNVTARLDALERRRRWSATLGLALARDGNVGATAVGDTVEVGPFRFRLDDPDRPESGTGLKAWAGWRHRLPLSPGLGWSSAADVSLHDWPGRRFDRQDLTVRTGPERAGARWRLGLAAEAGWSRQAGRLGSVEAAVRADAAVGLSPRLTLEPRARLARRRHPGDGALDGPRWSAGVQATFRPSPGLTLRAGVRRERGRPEREDRRSVRRSLDLGASRDLPGGLAVGLDLHVARTEYGPDWGFLTRGEPVRRDRLRSLRLSLALRGRTLKGFAPSLSVTRERRDSNAQLQGYDRTGAEFALVRRF